MKADIIRYYSWPNSAALTIANQKYKFEVVQKKLHCFYISMQFYICLRSAVDVGHK